MDSGCGAEGIGTRGFAGRDYEPWIAAVDGKQDIRLDPEVSVYNGIHGHIGGQEPLSDRYGLAVFGKDVQRKARENHIEEKRMLGLLSQEVFKAEGKGGEEMLLRIHSRIFEDIPQTPAQGLKSLADVCPAGTRRNVRQGFQGAEPRGIVLYEVVRKPGDFPGMGIFAGMAAAGILFILFKRKRRRRNYRMHRTGRRRE